MSAEPQAAQPSEQLSLATVNGEPWLELPEDLFIPPEALEIALEQFEGPLDLLLYLIRKHKFDIAQLPILNITQQYMQYLEAMRALQLELAAEYLVMAALLAEIKSRALLPQLELNDEDVEDPRAELIRRLQEYEIYKQAAEDIEELPRQGRDVFDAAASKPVDMPKRVLYPEVSLDELQAAMLEVLQRYSHFEHHEVSREKLSTRQRMSDILAGLRPGEFRGFAELFKPQEGRSGVVVTFLAILELVKAKHIKCVQSQAFAGIQVILAEQAA